MTMGKDHDERMTIGKDDDERNDIEDALLRGIYNQPALPVPFTTVLRLEDREESHLSRGSL
jgi:hypothetical protein